MISFSRIYRFVLIFIHKGVSEIEANVAAKTVRVLADDTASEENMLGSFKIFTKRATGCYIHY